MTILAPVWLQAGSYSAESDRQAISALALPSPSNPFSARSGILSKPTSYNMFVGQTATASMQLNVDPGVAYVTGTYSQGQGTYVVTNDGVASVTVQTASTSGSRIDALILEVLDSVYSGTSNTAQLRVVPGAPSGTTPVAPTTPQNSLLLAYILVPTSSTSIVQGNITDMRTYTGTRSDAIICTSTRRPANPTDHMRIFETDTQYYRRWDGTTWVYAGTNAPPLNTYNNVIHTPVVTAATYNQPYGNDVNSLIAGWQFGRSDPNVCTYNGGSRHFTITERGLYSINGQATGDVGYQGRQHLQISLPGGGQSTYTGDIFDARQRSAGYPGCGYLVQNVSATFYAEAGWEFWFGVYQWNTASAVLNVTTWMTLTRLPG